MLIPRETGRILGSVLSESEIVSSLKYAYGLEAVELTLLPGEVDSNLRATCRDGSEYLVKISGDADSDRSRVEWTNRVLQHIGASPVDLPVPRLVAATDGEYFAELGERPDLRILRVMTWQPGTILGRLSRPSDALWAEVGMVAARLHLALRGLEADPGQRTHYWDLRFARRAVETAAAQLGDASVGALLERSLARYDRAIPLLGKLPLSTVHHDLNDHNLLVERDESRVHHVSGIVDFSDALYTARVMDLAIACAYAMLNSPVPLDRAARVVGGYNSVVQLEDAELAALFGLILGRAATNAATWASRAGTANDPGAVRIERAWELVGILDRTSSDLGEATFRHACGLDPQSPAGAALVAWLRRLPADGHSGEVSVGEPPGNAADEGLREVPARRRRTGPEEPELFELGQTLRQPPGGIVSVPERGTVERADTAAGVVVVRHAVDGGLLFWTQWSGIAPTVVAGTTLDAGTAIGTVRPAFGAEPGLARVLVFTSPDFVSSSVPWHVRPSARSIWEALSPDPGLLVGGSRPAGPKSGAEALRQRARHAASSQRTYFREPMNVVSGRDVWLHDEYGFSYLDAINNVSHVGHCHPAVTEAVVRQVRQLNTNSRLLYEAFGNYAERLSALLPEPLDTVFFTCTGSEANDLAVRIVRQVTGRQDVLVIDGAYHGNTTAAMAISPDRFLGKGGGGCPPETHVIRQPNLYRGPYRYGDDQAGVKYAQDAADVTKELVDQGRPPAAMFAEALIGTGGEVPLPPGYLAATFDAVRKAGGLCVSDEIQVGLGRLGSGLWGFGEHGVVPDVVTLGKPLANGMPLAAVVTSRQIAESFDNGMRYFNTFAGNPVSCAAGLAVLDVIEREGLQEQAEQVGAYLLKELKRLGERHVLIGDVRGSGLYIGVELVRDHDTLEPAGPEALYICERMKEEGVLMYPNGPHGNVLKIKPPMTFRTEHADLFVQVLDQVLSEEW
jgi:4-aminobutyrate aminotransferase-like enzyme/Ser/Thr protein kinase RdoA (MazF antagonist)